jgi:hypothetical protein
VKDVEEAERKIMRILEKIQEEIEGSIVKKINYGIGLEI